MNIKRLTKPVIMLAAIATFAIQTGCASNPSQARQLADEQGFSVIDDLDDVETKKGYKGKGTFVGLALTSASLIAGGGDTGLTTGALYFQGNPMQDERHSSWAYVSKDLAKSESEVIEKIADEWKVAITMALEKEGFDVSLTDIQPVKAEEGDETDGVQGVWNILRDDIGCTKELKPSEKCAVFMFTGHRVNNEWSRKGYWAVENTGYAYPHIKIRTPTESPYNQVGFYKAVTDALGKDHYIFLSREEQVWVGDGMVYNHPVIITEGKELLFVSPKQN